jgi:hypothetical protein
MKKTILNMKKTILNMKKTILIILITATALLNAGAQVVVTFNANTEGPLVGQDGTPAEGLTGTWEGSVKPVVTMDDLSSPYAIAQTGIAQKLVGTGNDNGDSRANAAFSTSISGTVYFSFLANTSDSAGRVCLNWNTGATDPTTTIAAVGFGVVFKDGDLTYYRRGGHPVDSVPSSNWGEVQFIVGRIDFDDSGENDRVQIWLNPDLSKGDLGTADIDNAQHNSGPNSPASVCPFTAWEARPRVRARSTTSGSVRHSTLSRFQKPTRHPGNKEWTRPKSDLFT